MSNETESRLATFVDNLRFFWKQFRTTFLVVAAAGFLAGVKVGAIITYLLIVD